MKFRELYRKLIVILIVSSIASCGDTRSESTNLKAQKAYSNIIGEWEVTHAEVVNKPEGIATDKTVKQIEETANKYEYRFFENNRFERGQPKTFLSGLEEMHGHYKIDSLDKKIVWYLEWNNKTIVDTTSFDYIEVNPYKIVMIEPYGAFKTLVILNRKE